MRDISEYPHIIYTYWHSYAVGARNKFACNTSKQCIKGNDVTIDYLYLEENISS